MFIQNIAKHKVKIMPDLNDIIWAAETFESYYYNSAYLHVLRQEAFLNTLRNSPQKLDVNDVRNILVDFLNKWGCRLRNYDNVTASNLKDCIAGIHPELLTIQNFSILEFDFEDTSNKKKIGNIFNRFWHYGSQIAKNFGPTATSKTLHIINPQLFTMWDDDIRTHYWAHNRDIIDSGRGYFFFLIEIKQIAERLVNECRGRFDTNNPALWLSEQLNINPPLSLVKFIDEFNWLVFKRGLERPQDWAPQL